MSKDKYPSQGPERISAPNGGYCLYSLRACARLSFVHGPTQSGLAMRYIYPPSGINSKITTAPELHEFRGDLKKKTFPHSKCI